MYEDYFETIQTIFGFFVGDLSPSEIEFQTVVTASNVKTALKYYLAYRNDRRLTKLNSMPLCW